MKRHRLRVDLGEIESYIKGGMTCRQIQRRTGLSETSVHRVIQQLAPGSTAAGEATASTSTATAGGRA